MPNGLVFRIVVYIRIVYVVVSFYLVSRPPTHHYIALHLALYKAVIAFRFVKAFAPQSINHRILNAFFQTQALRIELLTRPI